MRADRSSTRRHANRLTTLRALVVSFGLHAAAAAAYGGYRLGGYADSQPSVELGGGAFVAISIRGAPGGAAGGPVAALPADVVASFDPPLPPPPQAPLPVPAPAPEPPTSTVDPLPEPRAVPPPAVIAVLDVEAPALADLAAEVGRDVAAVVEASLEHIRRQQYAPPPRPALSQTPGAGLASAAGGGAGGDVGEDQGAGEGDRPAGDGGDGGDGGGGGLGVGRNPPPEYPQAARLAGQEGVVIVLMLCDATGAVQDAWIEESSGYPLLDEAELAAVRKWTFVPAVQGGVAVAGYVRRPISFTLAR